MIKRGVALALLLCFGSGVFPAAAGEGEGLEAEEELITIRTKEGLIFKVPSDMPIVKRGGVVAPLPMEEYLHMKMKKLTRRLELLDERLERFSERLEALERKRAEAQAAPQPQLPTEPSPRPPQ